MVRGIVRVIARSSLGDDPGDLELAGAAGPRTADRPGAVGLTGLDAGRTVRDARLLW